MIIKTEQEMILLGQNIAKDYKKILLYGDFGAGKTHFVKGFAINLDIEKDKVQSPTYTYINQYNNKLLHIDMYRLNNENDFIEKGILDQISNYDYITIERPKFEDYYLDQDYIKIYIKKIDKNKREIIIKN